MILLVYLTSFLLGVDVACGITETCNLSEQMVHHENEDKKESHEHHWIYKHNRTYEGEIVDVYARQRVNYAIKTEGGVNKQINLELYAHYTYMSMATHFDREDINLPGFHKFFKESSEEELKHAHLLMEYQNKRGGRVKLHDLKKPCRNHWHRGLDAMEDALQLEKQVFQSLLNLHKIAEDANDPQLQDFLESNFLGEQVDSIKELSNFVSTLKRMDKTNSYTLGEYHFDKMTLGGGDEKA